MDFKGKVVVITGASSGIGKALSYALADRGAKVVMGARHSAKLAEIAGEILSRGGEAVFEETDVTQEAECKRLIDKAISAFGGGRHIRWPRTNYLARRCCAAWSCCR